MRNWRKLDSSSSANMGVPQLTTEPEDVQELKDAIIELYLAIKIRSTEEVSDLFLSKNRTQVLTAECVL